MLKTKCIVAALASVSLTTASPIATAVPVETNPVLSNNDLTQINCMAENIYFEAGNQSDIGKIAVTNVVVNRTNSGKFPNTPCKVIKQRSSRGCQFSWVCKDPRIRDQALYAKSKSVATKVYQHEVRDYTNGATFYHATYVKPYWSRIFTRTVKIGDHIFYKG